MSFWRDFLFLQCHHNIRLFLGSLHSVQPQNHVRSIATKPKVICEIYNWVRGRSYESPETSDSVIRPPERRIYNKEKGQRNSTTRTVFSPRHGRTHQEFKHCSFDLFFIMRKYVFDSTRLKWIPRTVTSIVKGNFLNLYDGRSSCCTFFLFSFYRLALSLFLKFIPIFYIKFALLTVFYVPAKYTLLTHRMVLI